MTIPLADWTLLVYIAAHNNLDRFGVNSRDQILNVTTPERVRLALQYFGRP